jgi:UDP-N-acetylglucosamine 4,6-dehydratase
MRNKKIFITGGSGYIGKELIRNLCDKNEIVIYSRDEAKQYYLKKQFPSIKCVIGDVRNFDLMKRAAKGCNVGIFAASLKQIESVDQNPEEAAKIIINGAINSRRCAEENGFESACFISSDKSRAATTLYGAMKFVAGEIFIVNSEQSSVKLSTAIYGNVLNSTGSIIPLIWDSIQKDYSLKLYSEEMTRFMITSEEACNLISYSLKMTGVNVVPNLKSFRIKDLFEIYKEKFGLKYVVGVPRISEKIHEVMIAKEEIPRVKFDEKANLFFMHYKDLSDNSLDKEFSSEFSVISKFELEKILEKFNYFR